MSKQEKKRLIGVILTLVILICIMIGITYKLSERQKEQEYAERLSNIKYSIYDMEGEVPKVSIDEGNSNIDVARKKVKKASEYAKKIDKTISISKAKEYHEKARKILNESDNMLDNIQQSNRSKIMKAKKMKRIVAKNFKSYYNKH